MVFQRVFIKNRGILSEIMSIKFVSSLWDVPSDIVHVNKMDICLIPKIQNPSMVAQF